MKKIQKEILNVLKEIIVNNPTQTISVHLGTALAEYDFIDEISEKELLFALEKYAAEQELNKSIPHEEDLTQLIKDSENLNIDSLYDDFDEDNFFDK